MRWTRLALLPLLVAACLAAAAPDAAAPQRTPAFRILVFSKTAGYHHASIPHARAVIAALGAANGFAVDETTDAGAIAAPNLARYAAVVFLSTTGNVLDAAQQRALEGYVEGGGGWVGIHAAADSEYGWPWYGGLVGAWFTHHPPGVHPASLDVEDRDQPSTRELPAVWQRSDEWYDFRGDPRGAVHVLVSLDERSYSGGRMGFDHPWSWCHLYAGGRAWYTAGGHRSSAYDEPLFRAQLLGGILWAAGAAAGDCGPRSLFGDLGALVARGRAWGRLDAATAVSLDASAGAARAADAAGHDGTSVRRLQDFERTARGVPDAQVRAILLQTAAALATDLS
jgi:type 1 glutamine amidotransferase